MQEMLDIVLDYAGDHRFQIHPVKSNAVIKTVGKRKIDSVAENQNELKLGDNTLHFKSETPHLGLTRSSSDENRINIEERIALARKTLYSLIKTGVRGTNGLNPRTSCKIYQVYVIPRLLYGLETLNLKNKDMATLSSFHLSTLKPLQSLPIRTANSTVYLLLGILPISAELHKRQLSLLHQIAMSENVSIREIAWRQYNAGRPASFFIGIVDILDLYELPPFTEVMSGHFKKFEWKGIVKKVNQHLLEYKATTGLPEQIIPEPAQHYIARDGENSYCLGLDQQFSPGCKKGHYEGKNANRDIHAYAINTKEQVQPGRGGFDPPNMQTENRNHDSRYHKLPSI
jgi:hypothetical protein